jgi:hypothetical protein
MRQFRALLLTTYTSLSMAGHAAGKTAAGIIGDPEGEELISAIRSVLRRPAASASMFSATSAVGDVLERVIVKTMKDVADIDIHHIAVNVIICQTKTSVWSRILDATKLAKRGENAAAACTSAFFNRDKIFKIVNAHAISDKSLDLAKACIMLITFKDEAFAKLKLILPHQLMYYLLQVKQMIDICDTYVVENAFWEFVDQLKLGHKLFSSEVPVSDFPDILPIDLRRLILTYDAIHSYDFEHCKLHFS